ncbi:type I polyketide synthase [Kutzneria sp. NPDC052558]|uniref:type I polyketide synthase n=1 Tax=Kutzneria sp. NPDC052558 TaxID=3364121 RepID=UPI0037C583B6
MSVTDEPAPVAIIGMACRLPGDVDSPERLWQLLLSGDDAISEVPAHRWQQYEQPGTASATALRDTTRRGGYLSDAGAFDAEFFGITPREAELMDPQQRIVLETTWEALENAGIPPHSLAGTDAGVFVGVGSDDYGRQMLEDLPRIEAWTGIGAAFCAVANRVSYVLDLRGPSFAVDTACSSSLVALHLAAQSLRAGESTLAVAAGVNLIAGPGLNMVLDAAGATSPDGQSKPFDADANGYGRGEGAGVIVLKRLDDALRDNDRVLAVVRGSAVNQDGRTNGIMAPSGEAQAYVAAQALRQAGIDRTTIGYVEAHGTGTRAGDPIEAAALASQYGRPGENPTLIGSLKGSIGHLEAGAGIAGVIKAVLCLRHAEIPPTAGHRSPNPDIPWDEHGLRVVSAQTEWPALEGPRRAAVSSFGYGGTVGHVVLEQAPETSPVAEDRKPTVFPLSGGSAEAVQGNASRLADWLEANPADLADVAYTLASRRSPLPHRAAVVADDRETLIERLRAFTDVATGQVVGSVPATPVWVFSGHGSQWSGMGAELLANDAVFAATVDAITPIFLAEIGFSPREVLESGDLGGVDRIQPMIFTMQVALAASLRARGYRPAAVIGHSVGEIAAAVVAGIFDLSAGATLISRRSKLLRRVAGKGAMAMVSLPFNEIAARLGDRTDVVAAIESSTGSSVIAGDIAAVDQVRAELEQDGIRVRKVDSDVAFHSPQMDPLLDELTAAVSELALAEPTIPVYSTASSDPRTSIPRDGAYWAANLRNPVLLNTAVRAAAADGHRLFLEIAPHPVVTHSISETLSDGGLDEAFAIGTLRRNLPERSTLDANLAELFCAGGEPAETTGNLLSLPAQAWQHRQFWRAPTEAGAGAVGHDPASETLLGSRVVVAGAPALRIWQTELDFDRRPYAGTHPIHGVEIVPAAVLLSTFLSATHRRELNDISLRVPVSMDPPRRVQVVADGDSVRLASQLVETADDLAWQVHTTARAGESGIDTGFNLAAARGRCAEAREPGSVVARLHAVGVADKGFGWEVTELSAGDGELLATVAATAEATDQWGSIVDAVLTLIPLLYTGDPVLRMPSHIKRFAVADQAPATVVVHVQHGDAGLVEAVVTDLDGTVVCTLEGVRYDTLAGSTSDAHPRQLTHEVVWTDQVIPAQRKTVLRTTVVLGAGPVAEAVARAVQEEGFTAHAIASVDELDAAMADLGAGDAILVTAGDDPVDSAWTLAQAAQRVAAKAGTWAPKLWAVTVGQVEGENLGHSPVWGLGRVIGGEHPDLWGGVLDLDRNLDTTRLVDALRGTGEQNILALREEKVLAARLRPLVTPPAEPPARTTALSTEGTYLITGGLGVLGLEVAAWLGRKGARRVVLLARSGLPGRVEWDTVTDPAARERIDAIRALEAAGVTVKVVQADITDRDAVAAALAPERLDLPAIRGIVHAAGTLDNRVLSELDRASLERVMAPKVAGALVLNELFPVGSIDFLALFSSAGPLLGLTGQASYASANAFLDALARSRPDATSFAWTSWRGMGMAVSEVVDQELKDRGVGDISLTEAFASWEHAARFGHATVAVLRTTELEQGSTPLPLLRDLDFAQETEGAVGAAVALPDDPAELRAQLLEGIKADVADELRMAVEDLAIDRVLADLGMDSVMTLAIRRRIEKRVRLKLPATLLWNHPTIAAVTDFVVEKLVGDLTNVGG